MGPRKLLTRPGMFVAAVVSLLAGSLSAAAPAQAGFTDYWTFQRIDMSKCLEVGEMATYTGAAIVQWDCWSGPNQQWKFESVGGGWSQVRNRHSGKCLDVLWGGTTNGAQLVQWDCNGSATQQRRSHWVCANGWCVDEELINGASNRCADVLNIAGHNGALLGLWDCNKMPNQRWFMAPVWDGPPPVIK